MPKTNLVVACTDFNNKRTEYQKLVNILVDDKRDLADIIKECDDDHELLAKLKAAYNESTEAVEFLAKVLSTLLDMLDGVLDEDDFNKLKKIIEEGKK